MFVEKLKKDEKRALLVRACVEKPYICGVKNDRAMDFTMYDTLLQLPLFQGLGKNDITEILSKVKFHFKKYEPGEYIYRQGNVCMEVAFILNGTVMAENDSRSKTYVFCETLPVPHMVELYSLFGIYPCFHASYKAVTAVNVLVIEKRYLLEQLNSYIPCGLNFSNIICSRVHYLYQRIWSDTTGSLRVRFVQFLMQRSCCLTGYKLLRIKMEDLATLLDDRRINVSRMLNELQAEGLVTLRRKEIEIPALEKLY